MEEQKLEALKEEYRSQSNAATAYPIYIVLQELYFASVLDEDYGYSGEGEIRYEYSFEGWDEEPFKDKSSCVKALREYYEGEPRHIIKNAINSVDEFSCLYLWRGVEIFFTRKGGEEYLEKNRHNLGETRFYVKHISGRNKEMRDVVAHLGLKENDNDF